MHVPNPDLGSSCPTGTQDADENGTCEPDCASTACGNGTCTESTATGLATCECDAGFIGAACDTLARPETSTADFWIDANEATSLSYHTGRFVSRWDDLTTGNSDGASVDQGTAPLRVDGAQNGLSVIRFDGVDDELAFTNFDAFSQTSASYTMFMVVSTAPSPGGAIFYGVGPTFDEVEMRALENDQDPINFTHAPNNALFDVEVEARGVHYGDGNSWSNGAFHLVTVQRTRDSLAMWIDGNNMVGEWDAFGSDASQILVDALTLTLSPDGDRLAMDLGEMIVVSDSLHHGERVPYEDYLAAKWFGQAFERTPTAFGETTVWLDASEASDITAVGGTVSSWRNRGIDGGGFANASFADARPAYEETGLNGRPTVRFDGADVLVQNSVTTRDGIIRGEYTIIVVVDPPSTGSTQMVYRAINAQDDDLAFQLDILPTVPGLNYRHVDPTTPTNVDSFAPTLDVNSPHVILIERREGGQFSVRVDGSTSPFTGNDGYDYLSGNFNWSLGGETLLAPGNALNGAVSEFIVLDNRLNAAEEEALIGALREKWGI